ncbi:sensor protein [Calothrix sp. NIES-4101]|nr:sensor protein [Calothrix sp. NIES-4101]
MLQKLKLGFKFTLILGIVFIIGICLSGLLLSHTAQQKAEQQVEKKAFILMETMNAVRDYTTNQIQPLLSKTWEVESKFIPETIPAYSARQVFENLRRSPNYKDFSYKEATLNPTNLRDKADDFEADIVQKFRNNPSIQEVSGFRKISEDNLFYVSRPLRITKDSCLRCHSSPNIAPKSQINTYGSEHGFGWKKNEVVAAQTVYITVEEIFESYQQQLILSVGIFIVIFTIIVLLINLLLKHTVILPLIPIARVAQKISNDYVGSEKAEASDLNKLDKVAKRSDELGQLAALFRKMTNVVLEREESLQKLVQQLRTESDSAKKTALVNSKGGINANLQTLLERSQQARKNVESLQNKKNKDEIAN